MTITLQCLKNTIKVARHTGTTENFNATIRNDKRSISIVVTYNPLKDVKQDIYPYWAIEMFEEEKFKTVYIDGSKLHRLHEVRDIYNAFVNQGENSFLETLPFN